MALKFQYYLFQKILPPHLSVEKKNIFKDRNKKNIYKNLKFLI